MAETALSDFILTHRSEILHRCLRILTDEYPHRTDSELMNSLPIFIDEIRYSLLRDRDTTQTADARPPGDTSAGPHGKARKMQGFDLVRIVHDYGMVCDVISGLAAEHLHTFGAREFQILNRCIDDAIAEAIVSFDEGRSVETKNNAEQLGFIAHEIRNALGNATVGFELIRRGKAGTQGRTADAVQRALSRIADLVAKSLTEARLIGNVTQRERTSVNDLLKRFVAETPLERGVEIRIDSPPDLYMDVDERLLGTALSNLLQNAVKFTLDDQIIVARAFATDLGVTIEVEDRCGGLPAGQTEDLFRAYAQGKIDRRGQGLGLAITRQAVEAHAGSLSARNLPGTGCVFVISLPCEPSTA